MFIKLWCVIYCYALIKFNVVQNHIIMLYTLLGMASTIGPEYAFSAFAHTRTQIIVLLVLSFGRQLCACACWNLRSTNMLKHKLNGDCDCWPSIDRFFFFAAFATQSYCQWFIRNKHLIEMFLGVVFFLVVRLFCAVFSSAHATWFYANPLIQTSIGEANIKRMKSLKAIYWVHWDPFVLSLATDTCARCCDRF